MKLLLILLLPVISIGQSDSTLYKIPLKDNSVVYENVFYLDSINDKNKVFNLVKAAFIKNTNYNYIKIDEDRDAGNITTEVSFNFPAKPGLMKLVLNGTSKLSIDVKENRFRIRLYNNQASFKLLGETVIYDMTKTYQAEMELLNNGKWKATKSIIVPWNTYLSLIINTFPLLIAKGIGDDF